LDADAKAIKAYMLGEGRFLTFLVLLVGYVKEFDKDGAVKKNSYVVVA